MRSSSPTYALVVAIVAAVAALALASPAAAACPCTLFSPVAQPALTNAPVQDGRFGAGPWSLELGAKVTVDAPMSVSAIRFHKDPLEKGTHEGRIWTSDGTLLAQVAFTGETASGWQQQTLPAAIALQPGAAYIVSVNANAFYGSTHQGLGAAVVSGPLRTIADGANGVYGAAAGMFPNVTFQSSNYFVDLEVVPSDPPPTVTASTPASGSTNVATTAVVTATFSSAMDINTITSASFSLRRADGSPVGASLAYDTAARKATMTPNLPLAFSTTYTARLEASVAARDTQPLGAAVEWTFSTVPAVRINTGGAAYTTADGTAFQADARFTGGQPHSTSSTIAGTTDQPLYQNERWGQFTYSIPVANGTYDVRLHFAELYYGSVVAGDCVGKRIFGMDALDTAVSPDIVGLDICGEVGPNAALVKTIEGVAVSDGSLEIQSAYGPIDDPELTALEVLPASAAAPPPPSAAPAVTATTPGAGETGASTVTEVRAAFSQQMDPATITPATFTLTADGGGAVSATVTYDSATTTARLKPSAPLAYDTTYTARLDAAIKSTAGMGLAAPMSWSFTTTGGVRINAGGPSYVSAAGLRYLADIYSAGGSIATTSSPIANTPDPSLSQNERWGRFGYEIPVANGTYDVRFHFVELYYGTAVAGDCVGKRIFGMDIVDTADLDVPATLDVCAEVGPRAALVKTIPNVSVADGALSIVSVYGAADDPELAAIEIVPSAPAAEPTPPPASPAPTVTARSPLDRADGVATGVSVTATFSRGMNVSTITSSSFTLASVAGTAVAATVTYNGVTNTATLKPATPLALGRTYTARLDSSITAADGAPLVAETWSFTTTGATRINVGGGGVTTTRGLIFQNDRNFSGGNTWTSTSSIMGTTEPSLYRDERWGQFSYSIPVANGRYDVRFHFIELYYGTNAPGCAGKRVFGMDILDTAGVDIPTTLDICAEVGPNTALVRTVSGVTISDGVLSVRSVYGPVDDPELAAIEVIPAP